MKEQGPPQVVQEGLRVSVARTSMQLKQLRNVSRKLPLNPKLGQLK